MFTTIAYVEERKRKKKKEKQHCIVFMDKIVTIVNNNNTVTCYCADNTHYGNGVPGDVLKRARWRPKWRFYQIRPIPSTSLYTNTIIVWNTKYNIMDVRIMRMIMYNRFTFYRTHIQAIRVLMKNLTRFCFPDFLDIVLKKITSFAFSIFLCAIMLCYGGRYFITINSPCYLFMKKLQILFY